MCAVIKNTYTNRKKYNFFSIMLFFIGFKKLLRKWHLKGSPCIHLYLYIPTPHTVIAYRIIIILLVFILFVLFLLFCSPVSDPTKTVRYASACPNPSKPHDESPEQPFFDARPDRQRGHTTSSSRWRRPVKNRTRVFTAT